jgi:hypothetical protein
MDLILLANIVIADPLRLPLPIRRTLTLKSARSIIDPALTLIEAVRSYRGTRPAPTSIFRFDFR